MNLVFRLFLTLNATLFLWVVFMLKNTDDLPGIYGIGKWFWPITLLIAPFILSRSSIFLVRKLGSDMIKPGDIVKLTHADSTFLPSYLGYFFVALSVSDYYVMCFVYGIVFLFSFSSQSTYFNPVFLVLGYRFYSLETKKGTTVCLVSRTNYKNPGNIGEFTAFRINDHTLMEP